MQLLPLLGVLKVLVCVASTGQPANVGTRLPGTAHVRPQLHPRSPTREVTCSCVNIRAGNLRSCWVGCVFHGIAHVRAGHSDIPLLQSIRQACLRTALPRHASACRGNGSSRSCTLRMCGGNGSARHVVKRCSAAGTILFTEHACCTAGQHRQACNQNDMADMHAKMAARRATKLSVDCQEMLTCDHSSGGVLSGNGWHSGAMQGECNEGATSASRCCCSDTMMAG